MPVTFQWLLACFSDLSAKTASLHCQPTINWYSTQSDYTSSLQLPNRVEASLLRELCIHQGVVLRWHIHYRDPQPEKLGGTLQPSRQPGQSGAKQSCPSREAWDKRATTDQKSGLAEKCLVAASAQQNLL